MEHMYAAYYSGCVSWRFYTNGANFVLPENSSLEIERKQKNCYEKRQKKSFCAEYISDS